MHISKAVVDNLDGNYDTEPGHGEDKDPFLADNGIETYLIVGRAAGSKITSERRESAFMEEVSNNGILGKWEVKVGITRGVDFNKRTETMHSYSKL